MARWPVGLARVGWTYTWRTTPIHRDETDGDAGDLPTPVPSGQLDRDVQLVSDGAAPLLHRCYTVRVEAARVSASEVIGLFAGEPNRDARAGMMVFEKTRGTPGTMRVGDEFLIRMPGPWDGPVRVIAVGDASFRLATLRGHLEAGQIEFRATTGTDRLSIQMGIESWARPGDQLSRLLYDRVRLSKEVQLNVWVETCQRLAVLSGGRAVGGVRVHTRRVADPAALGALPRT